MEILNFKGPLSDLIYILKKGGSIHIKKKNRGKFTESAKRAGMGVQEYARHVLANKDKYSSTLVKRANFARNAKKFKHENGGIIRFQPGGTVKLDDYGYPADITPAIVTQNSEFNKFLMTLPDNLRLTPEKDYHMYDYWKLSGKPENFKEGERRGMFTWDNSDKGYHAGSIAEDRNTGIYHFMKPKHHPTVKYELDWFNKGLQTLEGGKQVPVKGKDKKFWEDFKSKYQLDTTGVDYRYVPIKKNGGILKYQNPAMVLPEIVELQSKKIWNSKPVKKARKLFTAVNDRLNGDREWISGEPTKYGNYGEYPANKGIGAIGLLAGPSSTSASAFKVTDLNGIKKVNIKLGNVDDYWYVGHQTGSANFPKIYKDGLNTNNGLNGTALHLTEGYMDDFANGRLMQKHMSHEGADGLVVMKFPKSKFPSGKLDDISERLMDLGESKSFEVPSKYLQFFKRSQW